MTIVPIQAISASTASTVDAALPALTSPRPSGPNAFGQMLAKGVDHVNQTLIDAEKLSTAFAVDDSVPLHQVTFALQEARLSLEMMLQVRSRLIDAYQQFAGMQL